RGAFLTIGGFDESFCGASVEDQEMAFRLAATGHFRFRSDAVVSHRHAADPQSYVRKKFKIGRGKATILRRHHDRAGSDSHTPSSLRWQLPCVAAAYVSLLLAPVAVTLGQGGGAMGLLSLAFGLGAIGPVALSMPLIRAARERHGMRFALAAAGLSVLRAWGLTTGFLYGIPSPEVALPEETQSRISASIAASQPDAEADMGPAHDREGLHVR
ncbi:MAG: hypothetical protein AAF488_12645, partial [Planctomycetota bacterium]